ncbi:hypothetical protein Droror1_Dr00020266 [Drosera rotundifolia]
MRGVCALLPKNAFECVRIKPMFGTREVLLNLVKERPTFDNEVKAYSTEGIGGVVVVVASRLSGGGRRQQRESGGKAAAAAEAEMRRRRWRKRKEKEKRGRREECCIRLLRTLGSFPFGDVASLGLSILVRSDGSHGEG